MAQIKRPILDEYGSTLYPTEYGRVPNFMDWIPSWLNPIPTVEAAERTSLPSTSAQLKSDTTQSDNFANQVMLASILEAVPSRSRESAAKNLPLIMKALKDEGILTPNVLAYALATVQHETAGTFKPIEEIQGRQQAKKYGYSGGENYFGRGFVQLTHDYNYRNYGERIGLGDQLVRNPELALNPEISAKLLAAFLKDSGTAALAQSGDFYNARAGVNRLDYKTYQPIADTAYAYRSNISSNIGNFDTSPLRLPITKGETEYGRMIKNALIPPVEAAEVSSPPFQSREQFYTPRVQTQPVKSAATIPFKPSSLTYTVQPGDTLWGTAQKYLGSGQRYGEIKGYTGKPTQMPVGTKLTVQQPTSLGGYKPTVSTMRPAQQPTSTVTRPTSVQGVSVSYTPTPPRSTPSAPSPSQRTSYQTPAYQAPQTRAPAQSSQQQAISRALSAPKVSAPSAQVKSAPKQSSQSVSKAVQSAVNKVVSSIMNLFKRK